MYDDAWYGSFGSAPAQPEKASVTKHRRRESLLIQPSEKNAADLAQTGELISDIIEEPERRIGPPQATIARRAASYSDFYEVAKAHFKKEAKEHTAGAPEVENLSTELELRKWYEQVEGQLLDAEDDEYESYRDSLLLARSHLDALLESTDSTLGVLSTLSEDFRLVESQTTAFRSQCQGLLEEKQRLSKLLGDVGSNIQYYNYLEPMTRRLNAPSAGQIVRSQEFHEMLSNLDTCIAYMQAHPDHRESQLYRSRYRSLLTRALTLIRVHFVTVLREIAADVTKRITEKQLNETTMSALLYAKFKVNANELREIGHEIEKRAVLPAGRGAKADGEYENLMQELRQNYTATRGKLVIPLVRKKIAEIALTPSCSKDLVSFARTTIGYIRGVTSDEYSLWKEWFVEEKGLYDFLEDVCDPLYDYLRPRIIHENSLPRLCELCILIQTRYTQEVDDEHDMANSAQLDFATLIHPVLEDAQTRLVFRTLATLRDEIENYRAKPEDLRYPAQDRRASITGSQNNTIVTSGRKDSIKSAAAPPIHESPESIEDRDMPWNVGIGPGSEKWFPTLKKAVWLLSRIYRLVNSTVFDDLAHKIVHSTTVSIHQASLPIITNSTAVDGQLFLIKHLLQLKSQIVAFDIEYVTPEVSFDFSSVTNTFWELRERGGLFNPRTLMHFIGGGSLLPQVVENMLDAKVELDGRLRTVINQFTTQSASNLTRPLAAHAMRSKKFNARTAVTQVREAIQEQVSVLRQKLDQYLDDVRTKETLVGAVQDQVIEDYEEFYEAHTATHQVKGQVAKKKGKGREDEVWDPDAFAEWTSTVFGVGHEMSEQDEGSRSRSLSREGSA